MGGVAGGEGCCGWCGLSVAGGEGSRVVWALSRVVRALSRVVWGVAASVYCCVVRLSR